MTIKKYKAFLESNKEKDMWNIIPQSVKDIYKIFKDNNKELYVVGGSVRDFLNNEKPKDFDLSTDAMPDEVIKMLDGYKMDFHGKAFGVVMVYTEDQPFGIEIATFREDLYNDKLGITRNPDIKFSTIEGDVNRRDITYNSLFYNLDTHKIIDMVGGVEDMKSKTTRFVGDPDLRIKEDPLRVMRLFRFNTRYGFTIDTKTEKAIKINKNKLSIINRERIWEEIKKAWGQCKDFTQYLHLLTHFDIWDEILPGMIINTDIKKSGFLEVYMANLLYQNPTENLENYLVQDIKTDSDLAEKVVFMINFLQFDPQDVLTTYRKKNAIQISNDMLKDWMLIKNLDNNIYNKFLIYQPSVMAGPLMAQGYKGLKLGNKIKELEAQKFKEM